MELALRRTHDATPGPKLVVAVGDCGCDGGIFGDSYATRGAVANVIAVDVAVPGCPPAPIEILRGILTAVRRGRTMPAAARGTEDARPPSP
jgi:Ni,Fe-hydrogenase III small subunit